MSEYDDGFGGSPNRIPQSARDENRISWAEYDRAQAQEYAKRMEAEIDALRARAEQAERERDGYQADLFAARQALISEGLRHDALASRVLALAEEWEASQAEDRVQRWTFQTCGQKLREAVKGEP